MKNFYLPIVLMFCFVSSHAVASYQKMDDPKKPSKYDLLLKISVETNLLGIEIERFKDMSGLKPELHLSRSLCCAICCPCCIPCIGIGCFSEVFRFPKTRRVRKKLLIHKFLRDLKSSILSYGDFDDASDVIYKDKVETLNKLVDSNLSTVSGGPGCVSHLSLFDSHEAAQDFRIEDPSLRQSLE